MSILIITVTALYASNKAVILKERSDVNISEYVAKNAISNQVFDYDQMNFYLALNFRGYGMKLMPKSENIFDYLDIKATLATNNVDGK